ncbi:MAG: RNA methyltransferase [Oligoflexia bacterium]|nr:RNA methyltransferase [Oligoflexia bacterium]
MNQLIIYPEEIDPTNKNIAIISSTASNGHSKVNLNIDINVATAAMPLSAEERIQHLQQVLKLKPNDHLRICIINHPSQTQNSTQQMATVLELTPHRCVLLMNFENPNLTVNTVKVNDIQPSLPRIHLFVALCRPPTMKKILEHASCMGVDSFHFFLSHLSEKSYLQSKILDEKNYRRLIHLGLSQSAHYCQEPKVYFYNSIKEIKFLSGDNYHHYLLDPDASDTFNSLNSPNSPNSPNFTPHSCSPSYNISLAIGGERGLSSAEKEFFCCNNFQKIKVSAATLRVEMAIFYALAQLELSFPLSFTKHRQILPGIDLKKRTILN